MSEEPRAYLADRDPGDEKPHRARISPERLAALEAATADGARPAYVHGVGFVEYADTPEPTLDDEADEQPLPMPGQADVTPVARAQFLAMLDQREQKGIATYGMTLQTWNGRDAHQDLAEEAIDLWQYATQARLERDDLVAEIDRLRGLIAAAVAASEEIDRRVGYIGTICALVPVVVWQPLETIGREQLARKGATADG